MGKGKFKPFPFPLSPLTRKVLRADQLMILIASLIYQNSNIGVSRQN